MAQTPNSNSTSYLTPTLFLQYMDGRSVADLVSDADVAVSTSSLTSNAIVQLALDTASGMVESACVQSSRYSPEDLAALTGVSQKYFYSLIARLAMCFLWERRPTENTKPGFYDATQKELEQVRHGERVFSFTETADAGTMEMSDFSEQDLQTLGLSSLRAARLFGIRAGRDRPFRG